MAASFTTLRILGIDFFNDHFEKSLEFAHENGGLILAPSGPGLADLGTNPDYDAALENADLNLIDSGYLALLWQRRSGQSPRRHSGLKFIKALIEDPKFKANPAQLWVMPSQTHCERTRDYLNASGIPIGADCFYAAPFYRENPARDPELLARIRATRPAYVILAIAGGKQEILGHWLRDALDERPAIICIGAAIAFLSGQQTRIPPWADRLYVGWLLRILADPKTFLPRYWKARKLKNVLARYGSEKPA